MPKKGEKPTEKQLAALKAGKRDFVSGDERTKAIQAQGVRARVEKQEKQYQKATFAQLLAEELDIVREDGKTRRYKIAEGLAKMLETEVNKPNPNGKTINALFQAIRDTIGEKPQEKVSVEQEKPFEIEIKVTGGQGNGNNNNA
jgi:hypothetical protein